MARLGRDASELPIRVVSGPPAVPAKFTGAVDRSRGHAIEKGEPTAVESLGDDPRAIDLAEELGGRRWDRRSLSRWDPPRGRGWRSRWTGPRSRRPESTQLPAASPSKRRWRCRSPGPRGPATAGCLRGPGPDRTRSARPGDPAALCSRPRTPGCRPSHHRPEVGERLERAVDDLDATIKDIRRTIFALGGSESSSDIQSEVTRMVERAESTLKFRPRVSFEGQVRSLWARPVAPDLLAVLAEALSNVSRHAEASNASRYGLSWEPTVSSSRSPMTVGDCPTTSWRAGSGTSGNGPNGTVASSPCSQRRVRAPPSRGSCRPEPAELTVPPGAICPGRSDLLH